MERESFLNKFGELHPSVARSEAIESLIQQNDDLMARLSVSLRRVSKLEDQLNISLQTSDKVKFQYDTLKDQVLILKEKTKAISDRKSSAQQSLNIFRDKIRNLEEELRLSEIRYAEFYSASNDMQLQLKNKIDKHARRLSRYLTYRERVNKVVQRFRRSYQDKINNLNREKAVAAHNFKVEYQDIRMNFETKFQQIIEEKNFRANEIRNGLILQKKESIDKLILEKQEIESRLVQEKIDVESKLLKDIETLKEDLSRTTNKFELTESTLKDLRIKLADSTEYIQNQSKERKDEKDHLTRSYDERIKNIYSEHDKELRTLEENNKERVLAAETEIQRFQRENQKLFDKCIDLEKVYEENVALQNKIVFAERKRDEVQNRLQDEIELLQKNLSHYRSDSRSKSSEVESLRSDLTDTNTQVKTITEENYSLKDQVENLQSMWKDNQLALEKEVEKVKSLQKLNQQLSKNVVEQKSEVNSLRSKLDTVSITMAQKVKELQRNNEAALSIRAIKSGSPENNADSKISMTRVDSLIAEIQSGFIKK